MVVRLKRKNAAFDANDEVQDEVEYDEVNKYFADVFVLFCFVCCLDFFLHFFCDFPLICLSKGVRLHTLYYFNETCLYAT